jgi:hypothetical protein
MQTIFSTMKVNNEYQLCEVYSEECKNAIEAGLLASRISYFMNYPKAKLFSRHRYLCVFCVNETCVDEAERIVNNIVEENGYEVRFLMRKNPTSYL